MLNNIFSSFDSKNFFSFSFLIINLYLVLLIYSNLMKINKNNFLNKKNLIVLYINITNNFYLKSVFLMIFILNLMSLNFFMFNMTSQFSFNMMMIFIIWLPLLFMNFTKKKNIFLIHLLPYGTSNALIPMMIIIELLSFFIRPLTLFLRLSINMIAGHVLVTLISNMILSNSMIYFILMYMYMLMKFLVSFIQSYIIVTLMNLYIEEI